MYLYSTTLKLSWTYVCRLNWTYVCFDLGVTRYNTKLTPVVFFIDIECTRMAYAKKSGFHFREIKGNLFSCEKDTSLAHCISADVHMGKGIATTFKKMFGGVDELRRQGTAVISPYFSTISPSTSYPGYFLSCSDVTATSQKDLGTRMYHLLEFTQPRTQGFCAYCSQKPWDNPNRNTIKHWCPRKRK
jgi:hypothetical protein